MSRPAWLDKRNVTLAGRRAWMSIHKEDDPRLLKQFAKYGVPFKMCKMGKVKTYWRIRVPRMVYDLACLFYQNDGYGGMPLAEFIGKACPKF